MYNIDKTDIEIANLLVEDGRMSCAEIARRVVGISERSARYRLERLIQEGVIKISAVADPKAVGFSVIADIWLQVEADLIQEVARKMTEYECISYVAYSIGETDVSVQVVARDTAEVYRFLTEVIGKTPGVIKTTASIVPRVLKDVYQWRLPTEDCIPDEGEE